MYTMVKVKKLTIYQLALIGLMTAVTCILGPASRSYFLYKPCYLFHNLYSWHKIRYD